MSRIYNARLSLLQHSLEERVGPSLALGGGFDPELLHLVEEQAYLTTGLYVVEVTRMACEPSCEPLSRPTPPSTTPAGATRARGRAVARWFAALPLFDRLTHCIHQLRGQLDRWVGLRGRVARNPRGGRDWQPVCQGGIGSQYAKEGFAASMPRRDLQPVCQGEILPPGRDLVPQTLVGRQGKSSRSSRSAGSHGPRGRRGS
jgi:hypothetical protein